MRYASMVSLSWCSVGSIFKVSAFVARFSLFPTLGGIPFDLPRSNHARYRQGA